MAIVLQVPRRFQISIGGLDHSNCLESFDGGDEKLSLRDGLVVFRGRMSLRRAMGSETLDDRKNKRWNRGTPIDVLITDDLGVMRPSPRGGKIFILSSVYDLQTRQLNIECGDAFALLKIREPDGDASGVCLGNGESKTSVINRLLAAAVAPALIDSVPGTIDIPSPKLGTGSYIDQAGALAAGSGCFLFVDSLNQVRSRALSVELGTPLMTISIQDQAVKIRRITGESPSAWFVVNTSNQSTSSSKYGFELTDEAYGPISIAGVPDSSIIVIRREWQKESLSGHKRFVETIVREPIGAVIPLKKGDASTIVSMNKLEIFEYENAAFSTGSSASDRCQSGNQGRLKKRTLVVKKPIGAVLSRIIETAPEENRPPSLDNPIVAIKEEEEFDYGRVVVATSSQPIETPNSDPNQAPPSDPATNEQKRLSGVRHTLKRWEPAGAISPEDYEWEDTFQYWIATAETLAQSFELVKDWTEARTDEWVYTERESISFNRFQAEAAAEARARIKENASDYFRNMFCALMLARSPRKVSSSGNTQPPAPDTMPSNFAIKSEPKSFKYKMPIDTDFPFRQKKSEVSIEYLSIDGNKLAEIGGRLGWGRFKGITVESEFSQHWWDYQPMCRLNILEPNITLTGDVVDTSAYLGEAFSIAIANQQCAIGIDGIFLGFVENNVLIPPFVETTTIENESRTIGEWKTTGANDAPPNPVTVQFSDTSRTIGQWITTLNPVTYLRLDPQTNTNRNAAFSASSGDAILNPLTGYREAYVLYGRFGAPENDIFSGSSGPAIARYEASLSKNGGPWSTPIVLPTVNFNMDNLPQIPGISFTDDLNPARTYVGPGLYNLRIDAISALNGAKSTAYSGTVVYPSQIDYLSIGGIPADVFIDTPIQLEAIFGSYTIEALPGFPGYPAISPVWSVTGPATITSDGILTANSIYIAGSADPNHIPIVVALSAIGYGNLTDSKTIYALDPNGPTITGIAVSANLGTWQGSILTILDEPSAVRFSATVSGTGAFNDDVFWGVVSGSALFDRTTTISQGEETILYPSDYDVAIRATSQDSSSYQDIEIDFRPPLSIISVSTSAIGVVEIPIDGYVDIAVTVDYTGLNPGTADAVSWTVVAGNQSHIALYYGPRYLSIEARQGSAEGIRLTLRGQSVVDPTKFTFVEISLKGFIYGVVVVPSKSSVDANETIMAQAYLTGYGLGFGPSSVGTQSFLWSAIGPANIANSYAQTATITSTSTAGNISLSASFDGHSASANIVNTGIISDPSINWVIASNYTVTRFPGGFGTISYLKLNDGDWYSGVTANNSSGECFVNVDLGSNFLIAGIDIAGGELDPPWPNGGVSAYLNGALLEYSSDELTWTTYATIAGTTDYFGDWVRYTPNVSARYWRIRRMTWCAICEWIFYV